jgi:signal transduction histidine kinase
MKPVILQDKLLSLKKAAIFSETDPEVLNELAVALKEIRLKKGFCIIKKGEAGDALYILAKGKVRIHDGNHVLSRMEEGDVFGEYALIDDNSRSASVTAEEDCLLLKLERQDFYTITAGKPEIISGLLRLLIRRMRDMNGLEEKLSRSYIKIRKQKEQIEKQSQSILQQKELLEQQNYDLTKLNEEKNHLISIVIHQIKNPLTSSLCLVEMLTVQPDMDRDVLESLGIIHKSLKRINNMLNELLDVNAIDSKVFELKMEHLNLGEILRELLENYSYSIEQKNIRLYSDIHEVQARLNRVYFTQIADNLLSNAVKFTNPGKSIHVQLMESDEKITLQITDEGSGIDNELIDKVFHQYRRQTTMEEQAAAPVGLGLAIVYRYVTALEGKVRCESMPGKGATFIVEFCK